MSDDRALVFEETPREKELYVEMLSELQRNNVNYKTHREHNRYVIEIL